MHMGIQPLFSAAMVSLWQLLRMHLAAQPWAFWLRWYPSAAWTDSATPTQLAQHDIVAFKLCNVDQHAISELRPPWRTKQRQTCAKARRKGHGSTLVGTQKILLRWVKPFLPQCSPEKARTKKAHGIPRLELFVCKHQLETKPISEGNGR